MCFISIYFINIYGKVTKYNYLYKQSLTDTRIYCQIKYLSSIYIVKLRIVQFFSVTFAVRSSNRGNQAIADPTLKSCKSKHRYCDTEITQLQSFYKQPQLRNEISLAAFWVLEFIQQYCWSQFKTLSEKSYEDRTTI